MWAEKRNEVVVTVSARWVDPTLLTPAAGKTVIPWLPSLSRSHLRKPANCAESRGRQSAVSPPTFVLRFFCGQSRAAASGCSRIIRIPDCPMMRRTKAARPSRWSRPRRRLATSREVPSRRKRAGRLAPCNYEARRVISPSEQGIAACGVRGGVSPPSSRTHDAEFRPGTCDPGVTGYSFGISLSVRSMRTGVLVFTHTSASLKNLAGTFSIASPTVFTGMRLPFFVVL